MILIAATMEAVSSRRDKTLKLVFGTQEPTPNEAGALMGIANSFCFLAIKKEDFTATEKELMEQIKADQMTNTAKTPSQRLRSVLFVSWKNNNEGFDKFDLFYTHKIEQIIDHMKSKLPTQ
jgi:hypothetical protein